MVNSMENSKNLTNQPRSQGLSLPSLLSLLGAERERDPENEVAYERLCKRLLPSVGSCCCTDHHKFPHSCPRDVREHIGMRGSGYQLSSSPKFKLPSGLGDLCLSNSCLISSLPQIYQKKKNRLAKM